MPGAVITTDKLPEFAGALEKKVTGDLEAFDALVIRVLVPVKLIGEETLHCVTAVFARG